MTQGATPCRRATRLTVIPDFEGLLDLEPSPKQSNVDGAEPNASHLISGRPLCGQFGGYLKPLAQAPATTMRV